MSALFISLGMFCLAPLVALYHGWAVWLLWNWFALPSMGTITWHQAVGLSLLVGIVRLKPTPPTTDGPDKAMGRLIAFWLSVLVMVAIAWVIHALGFGRS